MRYTINLHSFSQPARIHDEAGRVYFNGCELMPHEAAMLGDALNQCAEGAEDKAATMAATLTPVEG